MNYQVFFSEDSYQDIIEAVTWYEAQQEGLAIAFVDEVQKAVHKLYFMANSYPVIYQNTRRVLVSRFPFVIHYFIENQEVTIFAIVHGSKHPKHWQNRLSEN